MKATASTRHPPLLAFIVALASSCTTSAPAQRTPPASADAPAPPGARTFVYVSGYGGAEIAVFRFHERDGRLEPVATAAAGKSPSYLAFHPGGRFLYATSEGASGQVSAFAINPTDGTLTALNQQPSGGAGAVHLSVSGSGRWLMVANYRGGTAAVLPIGADGRLGARTDLESPGPQAHMIISDPAGAHVFVPSKGADLVAGYRFAEPTGQLEPLRPPSVATAAGAGPRHMAFHPGAGFAYLLGEKDSTIITYGYEKATGALIELDVQSTLPAGYFGKNTTAHVLVSPDGRFVYASNRGHDSIAIFSVDQATGLLTWLGNEDGGGAVKTPRNFTLDATGDFLLVANQASDTVLVFRRDRQTGGLSLVGSPVPSVAGQPAFVGVLRQPGG